MSDVKLFDGFGREVNYLRLSVTDRCNFRCVYCMPEKSTFLSRDGILSVDEVFLIAKQLVLSGVNRIRLTGGEPLVREGIIDLCYKLSSLQGLSELCMTTNGSLLSKYSKSLYQAGVSRINISLDTLRVDRFKDLSRNLGFSQVIDGIISACGQPFKRIKLNCVVLRDKNHDEVIDLVDFAVELGVDIVFIEEMPLGNIVHHSRVSSFYSSADTLADIAKAYDLEASSEITNGPAKYWKIKGSSETRIGFISPYSDNFCSTCNRVRLTPEGRLLLCLGNEGSLDLREIIRSHPGDDSLLLDKIKSALKFKPLGHNFTHTDEVQVVRFMNSIGG